MEKELLLLSVGVAVCLDELLQMDHLSDSLCTLQRNFKLQLQGFYFDVGNETRRGLDMGNFTNANIVCCVFQFDTWKMSIYCLKFRMKKLLFIWIQQQLLSNHQKSSSTPWNARKFHELRSKNEIGYWILDWSKVYNIIFDSTWPLTGHPTKTQEKSRNPLLFKESNIIYISLNILLYVL